ncbi:hypothetical protein SDC9_124838 [bioreactor metagenome]|uniref:Uncharacterized protein n=1 Tax=bioreactor metagenome TaxID=1076179 RepID=A0A645CLE0_9ZZZZ
MFGTENEVFFHDFCFQRVRLASSYHVQEIGSVGKGGIGGYRFLSIRYSIISSNNGRDYGY